MFDLHCHILPGVDDGARDMRESLAMLAEAKRSGINHIVCTPHCKSSSFNYDMICVRYDELRPQAERQGIRLDLGFEVHWQKLMELGLDCAPDLCFEGTNLMLLEFSVGKMPANWQRIIYELQGQGIQVIIAHPERYQPIQHNIDIAYELKELGCLLQLSGNFISAGRLKASRKTAINLLKEGLVDYVASDAHCAEDYADYREAMSEARMY
ncbi:CpsB/CapC family capsule biosynthesis tyrosine phosphatase [Adlercreutzia sp. ZJ304]|uniref:tyrosine-protein phosphatase n=1 Tax=Adlercreutzia sp. ZJ304 TaxID=2709791 RepID=UPI0013ED5E01|nr:CpsB/CapC family capsule biosynthesis tyrosine phosphatase [Adlercreutzia sp. ZJ304]